MMGGGFLIIYQFEASEELKKKIESSLEELGELEDGEPFAILDEGRAIVGFRQGNKFVIEQIVDTVL